VGSCSQGDCSANSVTDVVNALTQSVYSLESVVLQLKQSVYEQTQTISALQGSVSSCCQTPSPVTPATTGCPDGFTYLPDATGCYHVILEAMNWTQAQASCPQLDPRAHLLVITSAAQNNAVVNYTSTFSANDTKQCITHTHNAYPEYFTSGQRVTVGDCNSTFVWKPYPDTWHPLTYTNWYSGSADPEPNCAFGTESCLQYYSPNSDLWNDIDCWLKMCSICQIEL